MNRMLPGTRALRTFEAAGRLLNFTHAANEIGLTPAAVNHQIKEIEDQLNIVLFTRTSRMIQLTPAGRVLFDATVEALETLKRGTLRARKTMRGRTQLRLSVGPRFATNWLLPRLPRFRAAHPDLELLFDITDQVRDFSADDIDIAIRFGTGLYAHTQSDRLFDTVIVPICSPKLITSRQRPQQPQDLLQHTLCHVDCKVDDMVWPNWSTWMAAAGIHDFDDTQCIAFSDSSHVIQAVIDGTAIGLAELTMIETDLAEGRVTRLFDIDIKMPSEYAYYLVYPEGSAADSPILAFREWIRQETHNFSC